MLINFNHIKTFYNALVQKMKGFRGNWEQNDDTADDYIKNRTHWSEGIKEVETVLVNNLTADVYSDNNPYKCNFVPGQSYDVTWNGTLYKNVVCRFEEGYNVLGGTNGYPFYIDDDGGDGLYVDDHNWTLSISIVEKKEIVHKLDKKFIDMPDLPDNLVTEEFLEDNLANVAFSGDYFDLDNTPSVDDNLDIGSYNAITNRAVTKAFNDLDCGISLKDTQVSIAQDLQRCCYGNNMYVALSTNTIVYSYDGIVWNHSTIPFNPTAAWASICYGNDKFIAITGVTQNSSTAAYSIDGIIWTEITLPLAKRWQSLCYGNGKFIAIDGSTYQGDPKSDTVIYSTDGITWSVSQLDQLEHWSSVCYGDGRYVAIGQNYISSSIDGITWESEGHIPGFSGACWHLTYGNNTFVATYVNDSRSKFFALYSTKKNEWAWTQMSIPEGYPNWRSGCYGNSQFIAHGVAYFGNSTNFKTYIVYSEDAVTWNYITLPIDIVCMCYGNNKFIAFCSDGIVRSSSDGISWTSQALWQAEENVTEDVALLIKSHLDIPVQLQSDWNQEDETQLDYIKNKPTNISAFTNDAGYLTEESKEEILGDTNAVLYVTQTLTEAQKTQARGNIGAASASQFETLNEEKANKSGLTLGVHTDGLVYIFIDGVPHGNGLEITANVIEGDVFGYVDENNTIVLNGNLADGSYSVKYEMENGDVVDIGNMVLDSNVYYSVTNSLTNCTSNNSAKTAVQGGSYSATITANDGFELKSVSVTMGGSPVTVSGGVINISNVTGNIIITAVAEEATVTPSYTNLLPLSVNADGSDYKGTNGEDGYKAGYKMSTSSGNESATSGAYCSGFIPLSGNSVVVRIANVTLSDSANVNNLVFYDANKTKYGTITAPGSAGAWHVSVKVHDGYISFQPLSWCGEDVRFFRFSCGGITDETIVTVNEEIV